MNTQRVCDWSEVKPGERFVIHKQTTGFAKLGLWTPPETVLTFENGTLRTEGGTKMLAAAPTDPTRFVKFYGMPIPKQPVEVVNETLYNEAYKKICQRASYLTKPNEYTGADPEIFVVNKKGTLLPAFKFLPTQKEATKNVRMPRHNYDYPDLEQQSYAYRDGFAAEYFVYPVSCHSYVVDYVRDGLLRVAKAAKAFDATARLTIKNTFTVPAMTMNAATDTDIELGCKPSLNAYGDEPKLPDDPRKFRLRFTGGHVHLGIEGIKKEKALDVVKACDIMAAIPAVAMFANIDSPVRRQYYGRAGEFRLPKHGVEYRVLSNAWLCAPSITHLLFNLVRVGGKVGFNGHLKDLGIDEEKVREIINFCDVKAARKWVEENKQLYVTLLSGDGAHTNPKAWLRVTQEGVESLIENVDAINENWHFDDKVWRTHSEGDKCDWGKMCRSLT